MSSLLRGCAIVLALAFAFCAPAYAEESAAPIDPARLAAARDLMEVTGVTKQIDGMVNAMKRGFAQAAHANDSPAGKNMTTAFDAALAKLLVYRDEMLDDFAKLYAETFTADEMKTVADFYRSGTGAKFISMMPQLIEKGSVIGMKYSQKVTEDVKAAAGVSTPEDTEKKSGTEETK
jgi:hypothetical protein